MKDEAEKAALREHLVAECMAAHASAVAGRGRRKEHGGVFRRWLDDVMSWRTGAPIPIRDDYGNVLKRWGPPLAWFDFITNRGRPPNGMAAEMDFFLERNGLYLVVEFKSARGERGKAAGADKLREGQWRSLATLAKSGLFIVFVVEYDEPGGNDKPPTITRIRRLTDDVAPARRWPKADFGDLLCRVHEWWTNAGDATFVQRQKASATFMQFLQLKLNIPGFAKTDSEESIKVRRSQHEAMRIACRCVRDGRTPVSWDAFLATFNQKFAEKQAGIGEERSTD